jgi:hypothetical protein
MPTQERVRVEVIVDGKPLHEFAGPNVESESNAATRYIEVEAGQKFSVQTTFLPGFNFLNTNYIKIEYQFDEGKSIWWEVVGYDDVAARSGQIRIPYTVPYSWERRKDEETGAWYEGDLEFGALAVGEWASTGLVGSRCLTRKFRLQTQMLRSQHTSRHRKSTRSDPFVFLSIEPGKRFGRPLASVGERKTRSLWTRYRSAL